MGQRFKEDKIGALSHSSGTITLAVSRLTVGGQQYATSSLQHVLGTLTANTLYMLYVVISGGNPTLVKSVNVNSIGPAGFTSWKLVGAVYSNGEVVPLFGSFVNIEGKPTSQETLSDLLTDGSQGFGTITSASTLWWRDGRFLKGYFSWINGTVSGVEGRINFPRNVGNLPASVAQVNNAGSFQNSNATSDNRMNVFIQSGQGAYITFARDGNLSPALGNAFNTSEANKVFVTIPIAQWSNTPLKDL